MGSVMNVKIELPQHYIETEGSLVQRSLRSLKDGDAFAVFATSVSSARDLGGTLHDERTSTVDGSISGSL
jgi:hypothetical protein